MQEKAAEWSDYPNEYPFTCQFKMCQLETHKFEKNKYKHNLKNRKISAKKWNLLLSMLSVSVT